MKSQIEPTKKLTSQGVRTGLLFIPDISGFTELVQSTDVMTGQQITYELLSAIIDQNMLGMEIAEVEGDAILFYRFGAAPSLSLLLQQYKAMKRAFNKKCRELEDRFGTKLDLSLKVIAHYGAMGEFTLGGFKKLFGKVVVEAHRLMKNSIMSRTYLLLTEALKEIAGTIRKNIPDRHSIHSNELCEIYGDLRNLCFTYFDFGKENVYKEAA